MNTKHNYLFAFVGLLVLQLATKQVLQAQEAIPAARRFMVTIDRGQDLGQAFGSLFEVTSEDGSLVIGAGFQNAYNTRYRANRHAVQFFVRPTDGPRAIRFEELPRPTKKLVGAYLFERDGTVYSTFDGLKSWDEKARNWKTATGDGGTHETMRVGDGTLAFGSSRVAWNGQTVLGPPNEGSFQLFFYANGHLCFYHVNRKDRPYHLYKNDQDGFSRLYACPWIPGQGQVDLARATVLRLPVVGETTFAWGQLGDKIVTGSNIGGFYVFENKKWSMLLEPQLGVSYQLYSTLAFHKQLLMGQYPTGRVFSFDGKTISDQKGWPPVLKGVTGSSREAQTTAIYGGDLFVGVWPWGELWRYNVDSHRWSFTQRMFSHPELSAKITHPYDVENHGDSPRNRWGQRVTSLVTYGADMFIATSAKAPYVWEPEKHPFLAPEKWKSYGKVYRATMDGHLSATAKWTHGPTTLEFRLSASELSIHQDGALLSKTTINGPLAKQIAKSTSLKEVKWGTGIFGQHNCVRLDGSMKR